MAHIPFGYKIENGKAVVDPVQAHDLVRFFRNYLLGESIDVAGREIPLGRTCLGNMLKNPVYLGDDYYPRIIDEDLFVAAQKERRRRYEAHGSPTKAAPINTVPVRTNFRVLKIEESYDDPVRQAEYVYGRIRLRFMDW